MTTRTARAADPRQFTDRAIAAAATHAIALDRAIPGGVHVSVDHGEVTLTGSVHFPFQKTEAEDVVRHLHGVRHVKNELVVAQQGVEPPDDVC